MSITLIAATTKEGVIADSKKPGMLWHISDELKHFRRLTLGKKCIVGYNTASNMPLLTERTVYVRTNDIPTNIDIPANYAWLPNGSLRKSLVEDTKEEVMVIGGGKTYLEYMPIASKLIISRVDVNVSGDIYFPTITDDWHLTMEESTSDEFTVLTYERIDPAAYTWHDN